MGVERPEEARRGDVGRGLKESRGLTYPPDITLPDTL